MRATSDVWFLDVRGGKMAWEHLSDRPPPAMVATTFADGDRLYYMAFGTDWQPHEHATEDPNIYCMDVGKRSGWKIVTQFPGKPQMVPWCDDLQW